jgi:tRNA(fMet)-specific endonuclease VapC
MTGNNYLLDTNIITAWLKGEAEVADRIDEADTIYIPVIVIGELYYGAAFSKHVKKNTENTRKLSPAMKYLL